MPVPTHKFYGRVRVVFLYLILKMLEKIKIIANNKEKKMQKDKQTIMSICQEAATIEQLYSNDEGYIRLICKELNCQRDELLLSKNDVTKLIQSPLVSQEIKNRFSHDNDILEICEYPEDTALKGEQR